jgi:hypothetical protein
MPISALSAGNDAAHAPPAQGGGLTLDYRTGDRGPFRAALRQVAAMPAESAASPSPTGAFGPAMPAGPGSSQGPSQGSPQIYEGADALAALSRDLAGGGLLSIQEVPPAPDDMTAPDAGAAAPAADAPAAEVRSSWRNDDIKGRRLGDQPVPESDESGVESWLFGEDGFGFDDLIDVVNPLQHIPVVSSIYRWITGDEISPAASVAGGALFGGPIGMAGAMAGVAVDEATGRDLGEHAIAMMFGDEGATDLAASPAGPAPQMTLAAGNEHGAARSMPISPLVAELNEPAPNEPTSEAAPARVFTGGIPQSALPAIGFTAAAKSAADGSGMPTGSTSDDAALAAQMMDALNKYESLVRARVGTAPSMEPAAGSLYDGTL